MEVKYNREQIEEDILHGTRIIGSEVARILKTMHSYWDVLRPVAMLWHRQRVRVATWCVQCVLMVLCAKAVLGWWVLGLGVAAGATLSICYEVYLYKRNQLVMRITEHVNAVYDRNFDTVWTELMMVKIWKVLSHFPRRGSSPAIKSMNQLMREKT